MVLYLTTCQYLDRVVKRVQAFIRHLYRRHSHCAVRWLLCENEAWQPGLANFAWLESDNKKRVKKFLDKVNLVSLLYRVFLACCYE